MAQTKKSKQPVKEAETAAVEFTKQKINFQQKISNEQECADGAFERRRDVHPC